MVRVHPDPPLEHTYGALAQLGEHLLCKQRVVGSIPTGSTSIGRKDVTAHTKIVLKPTGAEAGQVFFENL